MQIINRYLEDAILNFENKPFLFEGNKQLTFNELNSISEKVAKNFIKIGLQHGDKIGILANNQTEWLIAFFAATKIGIAVVALSPRYRENELLYMINHAEVKCIISIDASEGFNFIEFFESHQEKLQTVTTYIFINSISANNMSFEQLLQENEQIELAAVKNQVTEQDVAIIIYTSGTTGQPKGVMITHKSILASAFAEVEHLSINEHDVFIQNLPLNHVGGITCQIIAALVAKASAVLIPEFKPGLILQGIEQFGVTIFAGVPTMYLMIFNQPDLPRYDLSSIRLSVVGGSNIEPALIEKVKTVLPEVDIINLYGLSESSGACILTKVGDPIEKIKTSIGVAISDFEVQIVDHQRNLVPTGELGEIAVKGDCVAKGYYQDNLATKETFSEDGWLYTGDMAIKDDEGYIHFKGRKKEMYIQGGFNIFPTEIENLLTTHPAVQLAAGVGVPDPFYGEVGHYFIVTKPKQNVKAEELAAYCKERLADYKIPKKFIFVENVPMTPAGKIQKSKLLEMV